MNVFILNLLISLLQPGITCTLIVHFWTMTDSTKSSVVAPEWLAICSRRYWLWRLKRMHYSEAGERLLLILLGNQQLRSRSKNFVFCVILVKDGRKMTCRRTQESARKSSVFSYTHYFCSGAPYCSTSMWLLQRLLLKLHSTQMNISLLVFLAPSALAMQLIL